MILGFFAFGKIAINEMENKKKIKSAQANLVLQNEQIFSLINQTERERERLKL